MSRVVRAVMAGAFVCALATGCARHEPKREAPPALAASAAPSPRPSAVVAAVPSVAPSAASKPSCITPESVGVTRLVGAKGASADEIAALAAARAELQRLLQPPSEFYVSVQNVGELVLLELWHEAAFAPENCGKTGNPGEKSRTLGYDVRKRRIVSSKIWQ